VYKPALRVGLDITTVQWATVHLRILAFTRGKNFTATNFVALPKAEKLLFLP